MSNFKSPLLSIVVAGRNDDYGGEFPQRLFRSVKHNCTLLRDAGIRFEYILAEWNPLPDKPLLSEKFVATVPEGRAVVLPPEIHQRYSLNPRMPFHEMAAKNAGLRRALGRYVVATNADILFGKTLVQRIAAGGLAPYTLYRAHRIDVKSELTWEEMQDPRNQLASGEGTLPPPRYLGAGGDFCLGTRDMWQVLRGFNERIRFSTRAKDWQFFLCAMARGVNVEFFGDVFHLDHEGGFRNTPQEELNAPAVHFGKWWDIEFGLPLTNPAEWGFQGLAEHQSGPGRRIVTLDPRGYWVAKERDREDREIMGWLSRSTDTPDTNVATLLHAICAAHRRGNRLICRFQSPALATTLAGFDIIARRFGVRIYCNWHWPRLPGYTVHRFMFEPAVRRENDWIVEQVGDGLRVYQRDTGRDVEVLPSTVRVDAPEFNPILSRRLLLAFLRLQKEGARKIAIFGKGGHTRELMHWGIPDSIQFAGTIDSNSLATTPPPKVDAVLLSSASFESDMLEVCLRHKLPNPIALYGDWPGDSVSIGIGKPRRVA
jgi:hypothetical protein